MTVKAVAIVSGTLAGKPGNGGFTWTRLSWVLGLRRLGFDTYFVEELPQADPVAKAYFAEVTRRFGLSGCSALLCEDETVGLSRAEVAELACDALLLLNIDGNLTDHAIKERAACCIYLDDDPGFTQFWHAKGAQAHALEDHDHYYTFGENIGKPFCRIPTVGIDWRATRPPVVLEEWPLAADGRRDVLTTIATWRPGYGSVQYGGRTYGLKLHEFRKVIELPERAPQCFELALDIHPDEKDDLALLDGHGWRRVEPRDVAYDPDAFRRYVQGSGGEFSAAQGVYVDTESGWISDRTVRYLASGKPALVQDTGFSRNVPTGDGLLAYRTLEDAVTKAHALAADYERHTTAARALAETLFDSDIVLGQMLDEVGIAP
jgi:hypothetical protein